MFGVIANDYFSPRRSPFDEGHTRRVRMNKTPNFVIFESFVVNHFVF